MQQSRQEHQDQLDKEMFIQWKEHPVTIKVLAHLRERRDDLKEMWASGNLASPNLDEMAIKNAAAQGACSVLNDLLNIDYVELGDSND